MHYFSVNNNIIVINGISYVIDDIDVELWHEIFSDTSYSSPARVTWAKTAASNSKWR